LVTGSITLQLVTERGWM